MKRLLLLVVVVVIIGLAGFAYLRVHETYRGYSGTDQVVSIPQGLSTRAIGARLVAAGVIRDEMTFRLALWSSGASRTLKAGDYRFGVAMTPVDVLGKIARGEVDVVPITFPEGLTIAEMARVFAAAGFGDAASFQTAARDTSPISAFDPDARDLEGYLFPDTYAVPPTADAPTLIKLMVTRFRQVVTEQLLAEATARGLSPRELVTLASIIEKETARPEERPIVAAVYLNRLRINMPLQCDPTVIYALLRTGKYNGNIRKVDLSIDSPYNTYRYPGLPPGPIAAPGKTSLEAAARPAAADYLYFVSKNDGSHAFAETLAEHNRNVQRFQVEHFRRR